MNSRVDTYGGADNENSNKLFYLCAFSVVCPDQPNIPSPDRARGATDTMQSCTKPYAKHISTNAAHAIRRK
jgi:hypothetical protein